jgi:hypothetical protein
MCTTARPGIARLLSGWSDETTDLAIEAAVFSNRDAATREARLRALTRVQALGTGPRNESLRVGTADVSTSLHDLP